MFHICFGTLIYILILHIVLIYFGVLGFKILLLLLYYITYTPYLLGRLSPLITLLMPQKLLCIF
ncbi:hypothetical protein H8356DRAFT_576624 [Neocallimastix lanati (nom. inval.)]|nr:hypothetical protein H8356DRAFT_576624 [Neocallimastix sp. JGI-2020a]